jgi:putative ABC transport system substrate-binding protein
LRPPLPWPAAAQRAARTFRLAFVHSGFPAAELTEQTGPYWVRRFFEALRKSGLVEGRNPAVERFSAEGDSERFASLVEKVVAVRARGLGA